MKENLTAAEKKIRKGIQDARSKGTFKYLNRDETSQYGAWARAQLKNERITIRVSGFDLEAIKAKAVKQGKKYQTFLGEIIHREAVKAA